MQRADIPPWYSPLPMKLVSPAILLLIALVGCRGPSPDSQSPSSNAQGESPAQRLRDQLSAGSYQLDAAIDTISSALMNAKNLASEAKNQDLKRAIAEIEEILNVVGQRLSEYTDEPPELLEVEKSFAELDDLRLKAIEAGNDSIHEVEEGIGILRAITEEQASGRVGKLADLVNELVEIVDDIAGAVHAFGGEVEPDGGG